MQTGILGILWHDDAADALDRLEGAFRAAVQGGPRASRHVDRLDRATMACLTLPSNARDQPTPQAAQVYQGDGLLVSADAWLIDVPPLLAQLGLPAGTSAAELIAKLYRAQGEAGLDLLDGDFAFILYDSRSDTVIARRDPFGVRPLFWAMLPGGVAFSSLPEVIPNAGLIATTRDLDGLLDLINRSAADRPQTLIKGLNRVPPGVQVTWHHGQPTPEYRTYWTRKPRTDDVPETFEAWTAELRRLMDRAVQRRLPANGDLAVSISSGLDSTSVAMLAERHLGTGQHIFASTYAASDAAEAAFPGMLDETDVASQVVAGSNRISWEKVRFKPQEGLPDMPIGAAVWEPDVEANPEFATARRAAEHGADVILTGWGGDNVVSYKGYGIPAALLRSGKWAALRDLRDHAKQSGRRAWKFHARAAFDVLFAEGSTVREFLKGPFRDTRSFNHRLMTGLRDAHRDSSAISEGRTHDTRANRLRDIRNPVLTFRLEVLACHGLRSGVRYLHPLLDRQLIAFGLTCPPDFEFRDGMFRAPIRAAMDGILPDAARLRAQTGYPLVEANVDIAKQKEDLIAKLDAFEKDPRLQTYFDFPFIRSHLQRLPSVEVATQHVVEVSSSGRKAPSPLNVSFAALGAMALVQTALDEGE